MTHAEALVGNHAGIEPSTCPSDLDRLASYPDEEFVRGVGIVPRTVTVYQCHECHTMIPMVGDEALNAYAPPGKKGVEP